MNALHDIALIGQENRRHVKHAHLGSWIAEVLRQSIAAGKLSPGRRLSEATLAATLDVSRNTLRQAFTILLGESIVEHIPNRGVFVVTPTSNDVRDIYAVRRVLEPSAVLWGKLDATSLEHMGQVVEKAQQALRKADIAAMADANQMLHQAIVALSGSATLNQLMKQVLARMRLVFHGMTPVPDFHSHYVEHNVNIVALLQAGEQQAASVHIQQYLDVAEQELYAYLESPVQ